MTDHELAVRLNTIFNEFCVLILLTESGTPDWFGLIQLFKSYMATQETDPVLLMAPLAITIDIRNAPQIVKYRDEYCRKIEKSLTAENLALLHPMKSDNYHVLTHNNLN